MIMVGLDFDSACTDVLFLFSELDVRQISTWHQIAKTADSRWNDKKKILTGTFFTDFMAGP